jgi:hypothetical protein
MLKRPLHEYSMCKFERPKPRVDVRRETNGVVYLTCGLKYEARPASLIDYLGSMLHQNLKQRVDDAAWVARYAGLRGRPLKAQAMGERRK